MIPTDTRFSGRTLLGAIDSFMSTVVHTRPFLASRYRHALEGFAEHWLGTCAGANVIDAIDPKSLAAYVHEKDHPAKTPEAFAAFIAWARNEQLLTGSQWQ